MVTELVVNFLKKSIPFDSSVAVVQLPPQVHSAHANAQKNTKCTKCTNAQPTTHQTKPTIKKPQHLRAGCSNAGWQMHKWQMHKWQMHKWQMHKWHMLKCATNHQSTPIAQQTNAQNLDNCPVSVCVCLLCISFCFGRWSVYWQCVHCGLKAPGCCCR